MADAPRTPLQKKLEDIRRAAEERDAQHRARVSGYAYADIRKTPISLDALRLVPEERARVARVAAVEVNQKKVALAAVDPGSKDAKAVIGELSGKKYEVKSFIVSQSGLEQAWALYKFVGQESKEITGKVEFEKQKFEELLGRLKSIAAITGVLKETDFKTTNTTTLFEIILAGALAVKTSDIHYEAGEGAAKIRFRLDGILHDVFDALPLKNYDGLISRVKLLSGLKINVRGEAQDGRFTISLADKEIEIRVAIIPAEFGETIVMRVLDPDAIQLSLSDLGLRADDGEMAERALARPNGLILNTGPTGSGKTTMLYAFLKKVASSEVKIITIEDPIEYRIEGAEQTQVDPEAGYTFASGLRAILRQDPDVILVGEVRDLETADIAMQASLTGHLVFSTLHTNDAVGAVPRLIDLGVRAATIGPALTLIIAQRLVRRLCVHCKKEIAPTEELKKKIDALLAGLPKRVDQEPYKNYKAYEPGACDACNHMGYRGRVGIYEFLEAGTEFEEVVLRDPSEVGLRRFAKSQGMVTMQEDGILKVLAGITSIEEVEKITGPVNWGNRK